MRLLERGASDLEIAAELGISPRTAEYYVRQLLRKFGRRRRAEFRPNSTEPTMGLRQRQVLGLLIVGMTDRQIADALGISVRTAEKHVEIIARKLGVRRREEIAERYASLDKPPVSGHR